LTTPNTIITKDKTTNHAYRISNTPSLTPLTHTHEIPNTSHTRLLTPITDNIHFATKQTPMTINNTNQQVTDNIDLAKKTNANYQ
jgi:hypothetical protein